MEELTCEAGQILVPTKNADQILVPPYISGPKSWTEIKYPP